MILRRSKASVCTEIKSVQTKKIRVVVEGWVEGLKSDDSSGNFLQ
jgi:hypothetical protein